MSLYEIIYWESSQLISGWKIAWTFFDSKNKFTQLIMYLVVRSYFYKLHFIYIKVVLLIPFSSVEVWFINIHIPYFTVIIIFNFLSAFCTFVKFKNEQIICFLLFFLFFCLLVIIDRVRILLLLLTWLYSWLLNKR